MVCKSANPPWGVTGWWDLGRYGIGVNGRHTCRGFTRPLRYARDVRPVIFRHGLRLVLISPAGDAAPADLSNGQDLAPAVCHAWGPEKARCWISLAGGV
jgi:hypothetical protein